MSLEATIAKDSYASVNKYESFICFLLFVWCLVLKEMYNTLVDIDS